MTVELCVDRVCVDDCGVMRGLCVSITVELCMDHVCADYGAVHGPCVCCCAWSVCVSMAAESFMDHVCVVHGACVCQ